MDFVALDFETANPQLASICQVGATVFRAGQVAETMCEYVDPDDYFDPMNVSVHGIDEEQVEGAPLFSGIYDRLATLLRGAVVVTHTAFDRNALHRATELYNLAPIECRWLDSSRVARRAWPQFGRSGYGLASVASFLGHQFKHHNAAEDARAAGLVVLDAIKHTGIALEDWFARCTAPVSAEARAPIAQSGNPDGPLAGEVVVFTGTLVLPRREAAALAAAAGCDVADGVTKETTLLVVGDQDATKLAEGQSRSAKHRKAETLISKGQAIRILAEADFRALVRC